MPVRGNVFPKELIAHTRSGQGPVPSNQPPGAGSKHEPGSVKNDARTGKTGKTEVMSQHFRYRVVLVAAACALVAGSALAALRLTADPVVVPTGPAPSTQVRTTKATTPWVGTWAVAMQHGGGTLRGRTVRQIVRTSIGGPVARVRLSNVYGTSPLTVRAVRLARPAGGSAVEAGTDRPVTFGGADSVTIAAGGSAASDPAEFDVPALSSVAVSFFLPDAAGPATVHSLAGRNNYVLTGEHTAAATLPGARATSSYFFLAGLDVHDPNATGALVAFGASITDGYHSTFGADRRWPDLLAGRLRDSGRTVGVLNAGISGNKLLRDSDSAGESALARFERDVLAQPGVRWVIISDDPLNDLGEPDPPSAERLITGLRQLVDRARAAGLRVFCSTLTPFQGAGYWSEHGERARAAINEYIRGAGHCDAVVDQDAATRDPVAPDRYRADLDSGDHLHPNDLGMRAIADVIDFDRLGG